MSKITATAALCLVLAGATVLRAADVTLTLADGTALKASYLTGATPGPALLLIHQCNADRTSWDGLATDLAKAGFHVLAPDLRGFGANRVAGRVPSEKWPADLDAWWSYLRGLPGVDAARMAAGGASCGVVESTLLAARHSDVRALVLLSGVVNLDGKDRLAAAPELPVFAAVAEQDGPESLKEAVALSKHPASTIKVFPGADHGVELLRAHRELGTEIAAWLQQRFLKADR